MKYKLVDEKKTEEVQEQKPIARKIGMKILPTKNIEIEKTELRITKKDIKLKGNLKSIKKALDDTKILQDDIWFITRYFTKDKVSTWRKSSKALTPILIDFFNEKLKGTENNGK